MALGGRFEDVQVLEILALLSFCRILINMTKKIWAYGGVLTHVLPLLIRSLNLGAEVRCLAHLPLSYGPRRTHKLQSHQWVKTDHKWVSQNTLGRFYYLTVQQK